MIIVYITNPNKKTAEKIAKYLLSKKLCACANIFKISSLYPWKNKIEKSNEYVLILKTIDKYYKEIEKEINKIHPYKMPCILKIKINKVNQKYLNWLIQQIKN